MPVGAPDLLLLPDIWKHVRQEKGRKGNVLYNIYICTKEDGRKQIRVSEKTRKRRREKKKEKDNRHSSILHVIILLASSITHTEALHHRPTHSRIRSFPSHSIKMHCYCANYYVSVSYSRELLKHAETLTQSSQGAVNCHNKVPQFGERCRLCTVRGFCHAMVYGSPD